MRREKELHATVPPHGILVLLGHRPHIAILNPKYPPDAVVIVAQAELRPGLMHRG